MVGSFGKEVLYQIKFMNPSSMLHIIPVLLQQGLEAGIVEKGAVFRP